MDRMDRYMLVSTLQAKKQAESDMSDLLAACELLSDSSK